VYVHIRAILDSLHRNCEIYDDAKPKERFIQCAYMLKVSVKRTLNSYQVKGFG